MGRWGHDSDGGGMYSGQKIGLLSDVGGGVGENWSNFYQENTLLFVGSPY